MESFEVPIIDIKDIICSDAKNESFFLAKTGKEIIEAVGKCGIFSLRNHGISEDIISDLNEVCDKFFDLPENTKAKYDVDKDFIQGYYWHEDVPSLKRETYWIHDYNLQFPDEEVPDFKTKALKFCKSLEKIPEKIIKSIDLHLGLNGHVLRRYPEKFEESTRSSFVMQRYAAPNSEVVEAGAIRMREHFDYTMISLLRTGRGLQIKDGDGSWKNAKFPPDTFVAFFGQSMEILTAGLIKATLHRVVFTNEEKQQTEPRHCVGYFTLPKDNVPITPFDGSDKYETTSAVDLYNDTMKKFYSQYQAGKSHFKEV